jgi:hypothetical protein
MRAALYTCSRVVSTSVGALGEQVLDRLELGDPLAERLALPAYATAPSSAPSASRASARRSRSALVQRLDRELVALPTSPSTLARAPRRRRAARSHVLDARTPSFPSRLADREARHVALDDERR